MVRTIDGVHHLRSSSSPTTHPTSSLHPFEDDPSIKPLDDHLQAHDLQPGVFLQRVAQIPLLSGVLRAYERGKGTSRVVRYAADLLESSVNSLSDRVVSRVGPQRIAQIDRYVGAALDRLGQFSHHHHQIPQFNSHPLLLLLHPPPSSSSHLISQLDRSQSLDHLPSASTLETSDRLQTHHHPNMMSPSTASHRPLSADQPLQTSSRPLTTLDPNLPQLNTPTSSDPIRLVQTPGSTNKSRWQTILVEAGMTAGGIGAAFSEESMKSLQYCLQWLLYASEHLEHQITVLRDFISTLNLPHQSSNAIISARAATTLTRIKKEVVETIRRVVDVVSKYAGGSLPEPAKQFVRKSILGLPLRWVLAIQAEAPSFTRSDPSGPPSSAPSNNHTNSTTGHPHPQLRATTQVAADRVLTFAIESLDMLRSITGIFSESVERADAWVERLRLIGLQHRNQQVVGTTAVTSTGEGDSGKEHVLPQEVMVTATSAYQVISSDSSMPALHHPCALSGSSSSFQSNPSHLGKIRSRSSTGSTVGEDDTGSTSDSFLSGCDLSTTGSINTCNTTLTSSTSNVHQEHGSSGPVDRSWAKRRKANVHPSHPLPPIQVNPENGTWGTSLGDRIISRPLDRIERDDEQAAEDEAFALNDCPLSSTTIIPPGSWFRDPMNPSPSRTDPPPNQQAALEGEEDEFRADRSGTFERAFSPDPCPSRSSTWLRKILLFDQDHHPLHHPPSTAAHQPEIQPSSGHPWFQGCEPARTSHQGEEAMES